MLANLGLTLLFLMEKNIWYFFGIFGIVFSTPYTSQNQLTMKHSQKQRWQNMNWHFKRGHLPLGSYAVNGPGLFQTFCKVAMFFLKWPSGWKSWGFLGWQNTYWCSSFLWNPILFVSQQFSQSFSDITRSHCNSGSLQSSFLEELEEFSMVQTTFVQLDIFKNYP